MLFSRFRVLELFSFGLVALVLFPSSCMCPVRVLFSRFFGIVLLSYVAFIFLCSSDRLLVFVTLHPFRAAVPLRGQTS